MKRILIFIGLKIAEIGGVCGIAAILYVIGICIAPLMFPSSDSLEWTEIVLASIATIYGGAFLFVIGLGIYEAIKANWQWADKIARKK